MQLDDDKMRALARELGRRGGKAAQAKLTPEMRTENMRAAVTARWRKTATERAAIRAIRAADKKAKKENKILREKSAQGNQTFPPRSS